MATTRPIHGFLAKNPKGGQHHVCFEVEDIHRRPRRHAGQGRDLLGTGEPRIGAHGTPIIFLHPKDMGGVLVELMETPEGSALTDDRPDHHVRHLHDHLVDGAVRRPAAGHGTSRRRIEPPTDGCSPGAPVKTPNLKQKFITTTWVSFLVWLIRLWLVFIGWMPLPTWRLGLNRRPSGGRPRSGGAADLRHRGRAEPPSSLRFAPCDLPRLGEDAGLAFAVRRGYSTDDP